MSLTVTDLFAGFGGASSGAILVPDNAVTPPASRDLVAAIAESLGGAAA